MNQEFIELIEKAESIGISGHVRPDGDCVGSTSALYHYIKYNYPNKLVYYFLEPVSKAISKCVDVPPITSSNDFDNVLDLFISLDCASKDRLGEAERIFDKASFKVVVDHHKTNQGYGDVNYVFAGLSSACEGLYTLLSLDKMNKSIAQSLYIGIVTDTGVFKYQSVTEETMAIAGKLVGFGLDTAYLIDTAFYEKTFKQNKLLARALDKAQITEDGFVCYTALSIADMNELQVTAEDTEGVVEQLRLTSNVEVAIFLREDKENYFKVSLRSKKGLIDVSEISMLYNGGGHKMAAGFNVSGCSDDIIAAILLEIDKRK